MTRVERMIEGLSLHKQNTVSKILRTKSRSRERLISAEALQVSILREEELVLLWLTGCLLCWTMIHDRDYGKALEENETSKKQLR